MEFLKYLFVACFVCHGFQVRAQEVNGKPDKLVIAHHMTRLIYHAGYEDGDLISNAHFSPTGPSAPIGGMVQTYALPGHYKQQSTLEETADFEMRAAKLSGVDGFQFYYPCLPHDGYMSSLSKIIDAYFRVAADKHPEFKLTLCLCNPTDGTQAEKQARWVKHIKPLIDTHGQSTQWLRINGRLAFYTWCPDALSDKDALGAEIAWIYHLRFENKPEIVDAAIKHFPAIWGWTTPVQSDDHWPAIAARCKANDTLYTQTVYPDYYTSKVYTDTKPAQMFHSWEKLDQSLTRGTPVRRHYQVCHLSRVFREGLQRAIDTDAALINLATWNDYPEGHHLAPEFNRHFAFGLLLQHYRAQWRGETPDLPDDLVMTFFKPYSLKDAPADGIPYKVLRQVGQESNEDVIEVVTILKAPAKLSVNGESRKVKSGLRVSKWPMQVGQVKVQLNREQTEVCDFATPMAITDKPIRTDRLTRSYSSHCHELFKTLFPGCEPLVESDLYK